MTSRSILSSMLRRRQLLLCKTTSGTLPPPGFLHGGPRSFHGTFTLCDDNRRHDEQEDQLCTNGQGLPSWSRSEMRTVRMHLPSQTLVVRQQQQSPALTFFNNNYQFQQNQPQFQQLRWKHGSAKSGKTREKLDENEAAPAKRQKSKDKQVAKKSKKVKGQDDNEDNDNDDAVNNKDDHDDDDEDHGNDNDDDDDHEQDDGEDDAAATSLPVPSEVKFKMMGFVSKFQESLKSMQGTDPTPELFDDIQVEAYGEMTSIKAVGQVVIVSPTMAQITCFDPSVTKNVQKAIQLALQLNPQSPSDGSEGVIQIPLPRVSMETRQETAKLIQKRAESCRQKIRTIRRKQMAVIKQGKDGKIPGISEDDAFTGSKDLEKVTQDVLKVIQDSVDTKLETILAVSKK